jgi:poly(3-hydroxyalkanoate) synthetase
MDGPMSSPTARMLNEFALTPLRMATAATNGWAHYVSTLPRSATPLDLNRDLLTWWRARSVRERPTWTHPNEVVREWPVARLRDYSAPEPSCALPTLLLPPQAGHDSCIVDYAPGQSQLLTLREAGLDLLYTLDWAGASAANLHATVEDYLAVVAETVQLVGGKVNLVGDCQGGWLAVLYTALHPERVNTLTIAGAPVDFHAGESPLRDWTRLLGSAGRRGGAGEIALYRAMVEHSGGVQRGRSQVLGFKLLEPLAEWERDVALLAHIRDPEYVARHIEFTNWFEWTQDVPGGFYLWIVEHLFLNNELVTGELVVGGLRVDLGLIECPLFLIAGTADHITPADQVWALAQHVATPPESVHRELVRGGHLGLFMGRESLRDHWAPLMRRVRALS